MGSFVNMKFSTLALAAVAEAKATGSASGNLEVRQQGDSILCYYTNWSQYRPGNCKFFPEDIDASLCTHLIFSFAKMQNTSNGWTLSNYEWNDPDESWAEGLYTRMNNLKRQNPNLKTLLAVGGWTHGSDGFTDMVQTDESIEKFITNSMNYVRNINYDGLDLDWEYPAKCSTNCSPEGDAARFRRLCELYRARINSSDPSFLLTAAVGIGRDKIYDHDGSGVPSYSPKSLTDNLDMVNLMVYDMHGHWEDATGHQALAHAIKSDPRLGGTTNVEWVLDNWIALGADPSKMALGLAAYGRSFKLANSNENGYMAPTKLGNNGLYSGSPGQCTKEGGYLAYYEICDRLRNKAWQEVWLTEGAVPYAHGDGDWVGYDNLDSIHYKVDMAKHYGLGGIMWWAVDIDDFKGEYCGQGPYPLIKGSKSAWLNGVETTEGPSTLSTQSPDTVETTERTTTTRNTPPSGDCVHGAFYPDSQDCSIFYHCNNGDMVEEHCAEGTVWDPDTSACNWEHRVDCCSGARPCPN